MFLKQNFLLKTDLSKRVFGLDILRAYAILIVLVEHTMDYLPQELENIIAKFIIIDGVSIFFVLSGFLIGNILIKTFEKKKVNYKDLLTFWINRWMRTIPPYYFVLTLLILVTCIFGMSINPLFLGKKKIISYYFFLQNFSWAHFGFYAESWSLTVEEWFYLLTPIALFIFRRMFNLDIKRTLIITIILFIAIALFFRIYNYIQIETLRYQHPHPYNALIRSLVVTRLDSLMYGVLGAYIATFKNEFWIKYRYLFLSLAVLLISTDISILYLGRFPEYTHILRFTVEGIIILFFLPILSFIKQGKGLLYLLITYISLISYSLYLTHYTPIKYCIVDNLQISDGLKFLLVWILAFIFSTLMYLYIEKPFMNLRNKIKVKG